MTVLPTMNAMSTEESVIERRGRTFKMTSASVFSSRWVIEVAADTILRWAA